MSRILGVEVHYLDRPFHCLSYDSQEQCCFIEYNPEGTERHQVAASEVSRYLVTEWLDSDASDDDLVTCESVFLRFQNGVGRPPYIAQQLGVRSMSVGDMVVLQTNNAGPKRRYVVATIGFTRLS